MALPPVPKEILKYFPKVAKGTVKATTKGWSKTVYYDVITGAPTTFLETPTVVCVAQVRAGKIPSVTAPTISIPSISLPRAPTISVPSISLPKAPTITLTSVRIPRITVSESTLKYRVRERLRDWGILNWFRDRFSEAVAKVLKFVWDILIQPQIDRVRNSINAGLSTQKSRVQSSVNSGLADSRSKTQSALNTFRARTQYSINRGLSDSRSKTQAALNAYRGSIQNSVNRGLSAIIPTLYSMTGLPDGQLMSPVNIRNVNKASFEFYALSRGMVLHYVAVGK